MAAVFPLDTTQPWIFNGVTYKYDAAEDRWYVVSTEATDEVVDNLNTLNSDIERIDDKILEEIDNRTDLINQSQGRNNAQDAAIAELDARVDSISENIGVLEFKGIFTYTLERSEASCNAAYVACTAQANGDPDAIAQCDSLLAQCQTEVGNPLADGTFTSVGTATLDQVTELVITNTDKNGEILDWLNVVEVGDYLELAEPNTLDGGVTGGDTVLYEVVADTLRAGGQENIRVKFIKETGNGDGHFDLQLDYTIRVFKKDLGIDINEADARYVAKPSKVLFSDIAPTTGGAEDGVLRNGELWFDTAALELFVWNNNAWVTASKPPSQDIVVAEVISDVDRLMEESAGHAAAINSLVSDLAAENNIYYSDEAPTGDFTGTLRNGDIWIDSDDLTIKFYSGGAWINPDRQVGGDYLEKSGGLMTGDIDMKGGPEPGSNIYMYNNGFIRFGWGETADTMWGGYAFMRDENVFEVAAYSNKDLRLKGKSIDIKTTNKVDYSITDGHHFSIDDADILSVQSNLTTINTTLDMSSNKITGVDAPVNVKDAANKEYADKAHIYVYKAHNGGINPPDISTSEADGLFFPDEPKQLFEDASFWTFSDVDQNGKLLNLHEHSSSHGINILMTIGKYGGYDPKANPNTNRDGMQILWSGYITQITRQRTGPINNKTNLNGWLLSLKTGLNLQEGVPGFTFGAGQTYYISIGGLM